jgi:hypothetical protein
LNHGPLSNPAVRSLTSLKAWHRPTINFRFLFAIGNYNYKDHHRGQQTIHQVTLQFYSNSPGFTIASSLTFSPSLLGLGTYSPSIIPFVHRGLPNCAPQIWSCRSPGRSPDLCVGNSNVTSTSRTASQSNLVNPQNWPRSVPST